MGDLGDLTSDLTIKRKQDEGNKSGKSATDMRLITMMTLMMTVMRRMIVMMRMRMRIRTRMKMRMRMRMRIRKAHRGDFGAQ